VCAYDRAGTGFSDGGPLPRNLDANADDLLALIRAAKIATPVVLVGHSYGTNVVRRAAEKHPKDVAALVLVDPPPQNVGEFSPEFEKAEEQETTAGLVAYRQCEAGAQNKQLDLALPELKLCLRGPNPAYGDTLNAALHASKIRPAFWQMIISITESNEEMYKQPVPRTESHGSTPLLILQPDTPFADAPPEIRKPMELARQKTQKAIAATSSRGRIIAVAKSSHDVQFDQPAAVVDAIRQTIKGAVDRKN
jgi:pimeloyl-ACP methyl ester carboxylesterase